MEKDRKILLSIIGTLFLIVISVVGYNAMQIYSTLDKKADKETVTEQLKTVTFPQALLDKKANQTEVTAIKEELDKKASKTELKVIDERVNGLEIRFNENVGNILFELRELRKDLKLKEDKRTSYIIDSLYIPFALAADK